MSLLVERQGKVETLVLDRPKASNAIDVALTRELDQALTKAENDTEVSAVVLTATGDRAFCAGMDFRMFLSGAPEEDYFPPTGFGALTQREFSKPLIGAINGAALGGGFELVLACDIVVAAEHATFGLPEIKVGHLADGGALIWLPQRIPLPQVLELALTGDPITAARAQELGLVNHVVSSTEVRSKALEIAERIASNAPVSIRLTKRLAREAEGMSEAEAWRLNHECRREVMETSDSREGVQAFLEGRSPQWQAA